MSVQAEGKTDLLKISFSDRDRVIAAEFVNALADALVAKQAELLNVPGAFQFFDVQRKQLEEEVQKAAARLESFRLESLFMPSTINAIFFSSVRTTLPNPSVRRGCIVTLQGQKQALTEQLPRLRPVTQSQLVTGIVSSVGATNVESGARTRPAEPPLTEAPPLLLVRVYQGTMAVLFKVDADLAGARNQEARRTTEERINTSLANARVSGLRIAQLASPPDLPASPKLIIFMVLGLVGGMVLAAAAALLPEALAWVGTHDVMSRGSEEAAIDVRRAKPHIV